MQSNKYDLEINQGATFNLYVKVTDPTGHPLDLTSYSAILQIRKTYSNTTVTEQMSTANGEVTVYTSNSTLLFSLTSTRTSNIPVNLKEEFIPPRCKYVYDLKLTDQFATVSKLMYGDVTVFGEVTR